MAQINDDLNTLIAARNNMKTALINKGQTVTNDIRTYANAISNISGGGGGSGDVKLYDSITNMNLDHSVSEGQLAIVYSNVSANITADTEFQVGTFPETVVLPTAMEDYMEVGFQAVDEEVMFECWGQFGPDEYRIDCYTDDGEIRIQYESSDGVTYTRTRFTKNEEDVSGNDMDFGLTIKFGSRWGEGQWNDSIGYFTQAGNVSFDGLYQYGDNAYNFAKTQFTANKEKVYTGIFYGPNGAEEGVLQNTENLSKEQLLIKANIYSNLSSLNLMENITDLANLYQYKSFAMVPNINTTNVVNMSHMFAGCANLVNVPNLDTSNVTNIQAMFVDCNNLTSVPNFNTSNIIEMSSAFAGCANLKSVPNFDTSNVTNMAGMVARCTNITTIPEFDTSNTTDMGMMFYYCTNLQSVPNLNTAKVTNMYQFYQYCYNLNNVPNLDTSNVTNMAWMHDSDFLITTVPNYNTTNVVNMYNMFTYCLNLTSVPNFDMSNVTSTYQMFYGCSNLTNVPNFNTVNAANMYAMFYDCSNLVDAPNIDVSNAYEVGFMFNGCVNLVNVPLLNIASVTGIWGIRNMFNKCNNLSSAAYANIANMLPSITMGNVSEVGLNIRNFTTEQCKILANKGYTDAIPYAIDSANVSNYWNIYYE